MLKQKKLIDEGTEDRGMTQLKISDLPRIERPSYKIKRSPAAMSSRELLALLNGGEKQMELAGKLYKACRRDLRKLGRECFPETIRGIGKATSDRILAAVQLGQRLLHPSPNDHSTIHCPEDVADLVSYEMRALEQEEMRVIHLNTRHRVLAIETVYRGSVCSSQIRVAELFRGAVRRNAAAIICVHNHPSVVSLPSPDDLAVSKEIIKAGKLLDTPLLDHIIIGHDRFVSLKRRGLTFEEEERKRVSERKAGGVL